MKHVPQEAPADDAGVDEADAEALLLLGAAGVVVACRADRSRSMPVAVSSRAQGASADVEGRREVELCVLVGAGAVAGPLSSCSSVSSAPATHGSPAAADDVEEGWVVEAGWVDVAAARSLSLLGSAAWSSTIAADDIEAIVASVMLLG